MPEEVNKQVTAIETINNALEFSSVTSKSYWGRPLCFNTSQKSHKYRCSLDFDAQAFGHTERQKEGELEVSIRFHLLRSLLI